MQDHTVYLGLGSNCGDRLGYIKKSIDMLNSLEAVRIVDSSEAIETSPLADISQDMYLNCVVEIKTLLSPQVLLERVLEIENKLGRTRSKKWASRTIDIDILLFGDKIINTKKLTIPHGQMHLRTFVLEGLCQLNPDQKHPLLKETVFILNSRLKGQNFYIEQAAPKIVSVCGLIGSGKTTLTTNLTKFIKATALYEPYDKNPFLTKVYAGNDDLALDSELFFLISRADQLAPSSLISGKLYISDYIYDKEPIFAAKLLLEDQLALHNRLYPLIASRINPPTLVIYLKDTPANCLERIHQRHRPYEQQIELSFLESLSCDYDLLVNNFKTSPVIEIDKSDFDCTNFDDVAKLAQKIKYYTESRDF